MLANRHCGATQQASNPVRPPKKRPVLTSKVEYVDGSTQTIEERHRPPRLFLLSPIVTIYTVLLLACLKLSPLRPMAATATSTPQSAKINDRKHANQLDANDPLNSLRKEFLIPSKINSGMGLSSLDSARYTHRQSPTATTAMVLAYIFAETL